MTSASLLDSIKARPLWGPSSRKHAYLACMVAWGFLAPVCQSRLWSMVLTRQFVCSQVVETRGIHIKSYGHFSKGAQHIPKKPLNTAQFTQIPHQKTWTPALPQSPFFKHPFIQSCFFLGGSRGSCFHGRYSGRLKLVCSQAAIVDQTISVHLGSGKTASHQLSCPQNMLRR